VGTSRHITPKGTEESTRQAAAEVLAWYGRCDVLVHCAAAFDQGALGCVDRATWRHVQAWLPG
jgi:NAD(P)-dependent dehydrogenase (short-subunit alcohol dehydrogenase family)